MDWKNILKAQLDILGRDDIKSLMQQYRGTDAKRLSAILRLIKQNLPKEVKEFKVKMDNPIREYDGFPHYQTEDYTANVILVIDFAELNRNYRMHDRRVDGRYPYDGLDERLLSLFGSKASIPDNYYTGVRSRKRTDNFTEQGEIKSYQITFPFKVSFDSQTPILHGAERLIEFLEELEELLDE